MPQKPWYAPAGTIFDESTEIRHPKTLSEIATAQQNIGNKAAQQTISHQIPNNLQNIVDRHRTRGFLRQGSKSFADSPVNNPWTVMPDGGFPFSSNGTINTPAMGSGWTDVIGPNGQYVMQVPNGYDGVIKNLVCFYNGAGFISGSGALVWRILVNGQAVRNYDNILVQLGVQPFPGNTEGIRIFSQDTIQFQVENVSLNGAMTQIFCFLGGWYYSNKLS